MKKIFSLIIVLTVVSSASAQYWSSYVLEKGFSSRDYFMNPHRILSLQTKNLDIGLLGIRPDSLSEISYQPARLAQIYGTKLYVDLKGSEDKFVLQPDHIYPRYAYDNAYFFPPYMARSAERKLQPILSIIYLSDISKQLLPGFKYGFSYELIHHQGTFYEYVPYWYYGAYDAFGMRAESNQQFPELPINVKKDGLDEKTETAHFFDVYMAISLTDFLSLGAKLGRIQTEITGDYLRINNNDDPGSQNNYKSNYFNERNNDAALEQNEYSAGLIFNPSAEREFGIYGGWIKGKHTQNSTEHDSSFYSWGNPDIEDYFSRSSSAHNNNSRWRHEGTTRIAGINGRLPTKKNAALKFRFEYLKTELELENGDTMTDTSFHHYRNRYYQDNQIYNNIYSSMFSDNRTGIGEQTSTKKIGAVGLVIPFYTKSRLTLSLYGETSVINHKMLEDTWVKRFRNQETETPYQTPEQQIGLEDKTLRLDKRDKMTRIALPVAIDFYVGKGFTLRFGVVKQILKFETEEVIDIWYRTDSTTTIRPTGTFIETQPERIDRYRATPTRRSSTSTDFRLGLSFQPSKLVRFDLAMASKWSELEHWQFAILVNL